MINTVIFDMGGTIEDIWYDDQTINRALLRVLEILAGNDMKVNCGFEDFRKRFLSGKERYRKYSEQACVEEKPAVIWNDYYLSDFHLDREKVKSCAEELAGMWEVTYFHRELRPGVIPMLDALKEAGFHLSVLSNTASVYSVFDVLEAYGIRAYFEDVTLSSVTGYRKPNSEIFQIALRQMRVKAENCCYVGDTISRDIIGACRAGFGKTVQIRSFLSKQKDQDVDSEFLPDCVVDNVEDLKNYLLSLGEKEYV